MEYVVGIALAIGVVIFAAKAGLDADTMISIINSSSGRNTATEDKFPRCVLTRRFDFGFAVELMLKDVRLCTEVADSLGVPMMVGNAVKQLLSITKATQGGNADLMQTCATVEKWAGVEVKGKGK